MAFNNQIVSTASICRSGDAVMTLSQWYLGLCHKGINISSLRPFPNQLSNSTKGNGELTSILVTISYRQESNHKTFYSGTFPFNLIGIRLRKVPV